MYIPRSDPAGAGPLTLPVTMNEMLLRGCMLKNSRYILGLVVYTGPESRIQMNAAKTPNKVGAPGRQVARPGAVSIAQR